MKFLSDIMPITNIRNKIMCISIVKFLKWNNDKNNKYSPPISIGELFPFPIFLCIEKEVLSIRKDFFLKKKYKHIKKTKFIINELNKSI